MNSIVLNATGAILNGTTANACYIAPVRPNVGTSVLYYDNGTKEVTYGATSSVLASNNTFTGTNNFTSTMSIGSNPFRYVPWTNLGNPFNMQMMATGSIPGAAAGSTFRQIYSIVGNTMYLKNYYYSGTTGGSAGTGTYLYNTPAPGGTNYTIDTTLVQVNTSLTTPTGMIVGKGHIVVWGTNSTLSVQVYVHTTGQLMLFFMDIAPILLLMELTAMFLSHTVLLICVPILNVPFQ